YSRLFFFSSRRRHTRWPRDWSSDVCSSDLHIVQLGASIFAARIINNMAAMTIELSSHVEPKSSPSAVTAFVSIRRKAAPIKNNRSEERRVGKEFIYTRCTEY